MLLHPSIGEDSQRANVSEGCFALRCRKSLQECLVLACLILLKGQPADVRLYASGRSVAVGSSGRYRFCRTSLRRYRIGHWPSAGTEEPEPWNPRRWSFRSLLRDPDRCPCRAAFG